MINLLFLLLFFIYIYKYAYIYIYICNVPCKNDLLRNFSFCFLEKKYAILNYFLQKYTVKIHKLLRLVVHLKQEKDNKSNVC